ncbi:MAG: hypothetical protein R6X21_00670 [Candidatus Aminicenantes bacterium]
MKRTALVLILMMALAGVSFARDGDIGLGLIFGEPSGISFKMWTGKTTAIDAAAAWSFVGGGFFQIHSDLLFHNFDLFEVEKGKMALYYGFGGRIKMAEETQVSLRIPVGVSYEFEDTSIELFLEIVPMLDLAPSTAAGFGGGVGFRYFF